MSRYPRDPYWLECRYPTTCAKCNAAIRKGARAFYYPNTRKLYCAGADCGEAASRDFGACLFDERGY